MLEITLNLYEDKKDPYYVQLYRHIRQEIKSGRIHAGTRLPAIRRLSEHLDISRNTVEAAYLQLVSEGYVESRPRSGLYVLKLEEDFSFLEEGAKQERTRQNEAELVETKPAASPALRCDFRNGTIDLSSFPFSVWNKISHQIMQEYTNSLSLYGDPQGEPGLRHQLAGYLRQSRGVRCSPDQIIVGAGTQQMLLLLCQLLGTEQQPVAVEDPGYNGARSVFSELNFPMVPIPLEEDGIDMEYLMKSEAKLVYVTPSHQFPFGMVLPIHKRIKLLQWAAEHDGFIIEDDYDSEFRYQGRPIPALQGLDKSGRVIYMGTFSKSLLSGIRISYMVLPESLILKYKDKKAFLEPTASLIHMQTLERFMEEGWWEKHLRRMKNVYKKKHAFLLSAITRFFGERVKVIGQHSGLHIVIEVNDGRSESELVRKAEEKGVRVYPTSPYWITFDTQLPPRLLLGFGGLSENELEAGIRLLKEAWT
ncbi:PLP-dependent aminotransferase family protein [Bacillus gobiensis]|uniref:MocR-like pyridoxine biosynthesis transcription factor PdxR n=1 Tax=Bacillus gobiensis TaxID=1441095 RepID=UPI003D215692